jgi:DNA-directed RNA polymerase specialized sigma24 family protein
VSGFHFQKKLFYSDDFCQCQVRSINRLSSSTGQEAMAELENWNMWQERCAAARCTQAAQYDLFGFAFDRFQRYLQKVRPSFAPPSPPDAWHAFESHLALGRTRSLKAWKAWLFARGGERPTLGCIQGGATLIMRDVVRSYLRNEHHPTWMTSLDAPLDQAAGRQGSAVAMEDLLPASADPLAALAAQELQTLAKQLVVVAIKRLSLREQMALTVQHAGKALSHQAVTKAAGCGKSSVFNALHQGMQKMAAVLQKELPQESPGARMQVARELIDIIAKETRNLLETAHPQLFMYIEEESNDVD